MKSKTAICLYRWTRKLIYPTYWAYTLKIVCPFFHFVKQLCTQYPYMPTSSILLDTFIIWHRHPDIFKQLYLLYTKLNPRSSQTSRSKLNHYFRRYQPVKKLLNRYKVDPVLAKLYLNYLIIRQLIDDFKDHSCDKRNGKTTIITLLDNKPEAVYIRDKISTFIKETKLLLTELKKEYTDAVLLIKFYTDWLTLLVKIRLP